MTQLTAAPVRSGTDRRLYTPLLCAILAAYVCGRILQVVTGPLPTLSLVAVEVLAALAFALLDGVRTIGGRGILVFIAIAVAIGNAIENFGVTTGFPFGHYKFLDVMGPKVLNVPVLLGMAYIGMGYVCWTMARAMAGDASRIPATSIPAVPVIASCLMVAWDLAQDPVWSTLLHAWVWRDGGNWFGVPLSNYAGWFLTNLLIFSTFRLLMRRKDFAIPFGLRDACPSIVFYVLCALGNILQIFTRCTTPVAMDGAGHVWRISAILASSALVSVFGMGGLGILAAARALRGPAAKA